MPNDNNILTPTPEAAITIDQLADRIVQVDETLRQQAAHATTVAPSVPSASIRQNKKQ